MGITDTAMLRPQVFAFCDGEVQVGLIASEKQAIDATLLSLSKDDKRICPVADRYWNARGGSHTDGGAFIFNLAEESGRQDADDLHGQIRQAGPDARAAPSPAISPRTVFAQPDQAKIPTSIIDEQLRAGQRRGGFRDGSATACRTWTFDEFRAGLPA